MDGRGRSRHSTAEFAPPDAPITVLVIDDDEAIRTALSDLLEQEGFTVVLAVNGAEALTMLYVGLRPDVILLDVLMPVMDGWDFRAAQLADPGLRNIPVVVISASGFAVETIRQQLQTRDVVMKPLEPGPFVDTVRRACGVAPSPPSRSRSSA